MRSGVLCFWAGFWGAWWLFVGGVFYFLACVGGFVLLGWWFLGSVFCLVDVVVLFVFALGWVSLWAGVFGCESTPGFCGLFTVSGGALLCCVRPLWRWCSC